MYQQTESDFEKLGAVLEFHKAHTKVQSRWIEVSKELNLFFGLKLTPVQWKSQWETAKKRLKKYGSKQIQLPRHAEKETVVSASKSIESSVPTETILSEQLKLLKTFLIKPRTVESVQRYLNVDIVQALGMIQTLKLDGYSIMYFDNEKEYVIDRKPMMNNKIYTHSIGNNSEFEFLVIGDSHWGQRGQQKSFVNYIYAEANRRGIKDVYHVGDISDGFYKNRPEHIYELFLLGADEQVDYIVKNWPHYDGMVTHFIIGNHDETHIMNGGCNIGVGIVKGRIAAGYNDFDYLGIGYAPVQLTPNCRMDLFHPLDGSAYAISYSGQKYMDSLSGGDKPNIIFTGHHHKAMYFPYRNIHYFEVPSMTRQSSWMKRKRIANESGAWFIKLKVDEEGTIVSIIPEHVKQYKYLENDF